MVDLEFFDLGICWV